MDLKLVDVCSGIGGFSLAGDRVGWETLMFCEADEFCKRVLSYYWPGRYIHDDLKTLSGDIIKQKAIERYGEWKPNEFIFTGGVPCQPFSHAGRRQGTNDDRHLWPYYYKIIRECRPLYALIENVAGLISMDDGKVLDGILADLENEGYRPEVFVIPACGVEAIHRRDRIWIVAHADSIGTSSRPGQVQRADEEIPQRDNDAKPGNAGNDVTPYPDSQGLAINSRRKFGSIREQKGSSQRGKPSGTYPKGEEWNGWPTEPPVRQSDDAFSEGLDGITVSKHRKESLKAYGNAIVPSVAYEIFKAIDDIF